MLDEMEQLADEMVRQCMDEPDGLSCAIEMIEAIPPDICKPQLLFFTQEDCPVCEEDRQKYSDLIGAGSIREVAADSEEGKRIMDQNNLDFVPTLALIDCEGKLMGEIQDPSLGDLVPN